jgi:hypothetical protein
MEQQRNFEDFLAEGQGRVATDETHSVKTHRDKSHNVRSASSALAEKGSNRG